MTDMSAAPEHARAGGRQTLIDGYDLVAALDRAAGNQVTTISAPAGSGKPRCYAHGPHRRGRDGRVAFLSVRPGQHDAQLFWLALLGAAAA
jgi:LuxR family maltose regulon positive regulatory protein